MSQEVARAAEALDSEPLARTMFGQRQLRHCDLLAWSFEALPEAADRVFGDLSPQADTGYARAAAREEEHIDLVLRWLDRAPLAIENKAFALPDHE